MVWGSGSSSSADADPDSSLDRDSSTGLGGDFGFEAEMSETFLVRFAADLGGSVDLGGGGVISDVISSSEFSTTILLFFLAGSLALQFISVIIK